jgi:hypothetical protein
LLTALIGSGRPLGWLEAPAFLVHAVPANLVAGGAVIAAAAALRASYEARRLRGWIAASLPGAILWSAATGILALGVAQGAAPPPGGGAGPPAEGFDHARLWPAAGTIALLAAGGGLLRIGGPRAGRPAGIAAGWAAAILLGLAAFLCVNALNAEEAWFLGLPPAPTASAPLPAGDGAGWLSRGPSLLPRAVHVMLSALAVAGLLVAAHGLVQSRRDAAYGAWAVRHGSLWFAVPTALQMIAGFWLLLALPDAVRLRFLGGSAAATAELAAGTLLGVAALLVAPQAAGARRPAPFLAAGAILLGATLLAMALLRAQVRTGYLAAAEAAGAGPGPRRAAALVGGVALAAALTARWLVGRLRADPPAPSP